MRHAIVSSRFGYPDRWRIVPFAIGLLLLVGPAGAQKLPADNMRRLPQPWPPVEWSTTLNLSEQTQPHVSEPRLGNGYFGQTLYQHSAGTPEYWTANVLIQDRGSAGAAWRAVSSVSCNSRVYQGYRARECSRGGRGHLTKSLHYQVDRFYVTIQVSGPGDVEYPQFELGVGSWRSAQVRPRRILRRNGTRAY